MSRRPVRRAERVEPHIATPREVRKVVADQYSEDFLHCRDIGHTWNLAKIFRIAGGGYERVFSCNSCKTNRTQVLSPRFHILSNSYDYEDGYQLKGIGRILGDSKDAMRGVAVERQLGRARTLPVDR